MQKDLLKYIEFYLLIFCKILSIQFHKKFTFSLYFFIIFFAYYHSQTKKLFLIKKYKRIFKKIGL
jgi:hypothetical protein